MHTPEGLPLWNPTAKSDDVAANQDSAALASINNTTTNITTTTTFNNNNYNDNDPTSATNRVTSKRLPVPFGCIEGSANRDTSNSLFSR